MEKIMKKVDFKSGLNNDSKVFNQALIDCFEGDVAKKFRPGDEINADTVSLNGTSSNPWSGNAYSYSFNSQQ